MTTAIIHRPRVFLDISHGEEPLGRLIIELFIDKTPKTCENFRAICTSSGTDLSYRASPFHRVIDEFMVQGGDITAGNGTGGDSIYGGEFEDENLTWRDIDTDGLVCMANRGKGTNSSQFFITLTECPHLNGKHTIFGQLVSGQDVLRRMGKVDVDNNDQPLTPLLIAHCGELERRKKQTQQPASSKSTPRTIEDSDRGRGRHKRRHSSISPSRPLSRSHSDSRSQLKYRKKDRKRSDHLLDSTFRGRARKRGTTDSVSPVPEDEEDGARKERKHKRHHRSVSPSRGSEGERQGRRRSSLPNQEFHDRAGKILGDGRTDERKEEGRDRERRDDKNYGGRRRYEYRDRDSEQYRYDKERPKDEEMDRQGERQSYGGRERGYDRGDRWRDEGRLGGGSEEPSEGGIKFKGRGSMKYRERW